MKYRVAFALLVLAASCSDSPSTPIVGFNGALSFTYTGGGGGTHTADGDFTAITSSNLYTTDWAYGVRSEVDVVLGIVSNQPRTATSHDMTILAVNRLTTGSSSISADCDPDVDAGCTGVVFFRGQSNTFTTYEHYCILTTGTVNIASISNSRATGTFSGSGFCFDVDSNDEPFVVTNGTFNVALLSDAQTD